jgi:hypothetical protein
MVTGEDNISPNNRLAAGYAVISFFILDGLVIAQALLAHQDRFFTVAEMQSRGIREGLPFIWHFGMWGDLLVISGLSAYLICRYGRTWKPHLVCASLAAGLLAAALMSWWYTYSNVPETHVQNGSLTWAGYVHAVYMGLAIAVFTQALLFTESISSKVIRVVCAVLFIHVLFGTHMILGAIKLIHPLPWYPVQPLDSEFGRRTVAIVGVALAVRSFPQQFLSIAFAGFEYMTGQNPKTAEGYLKFLDYTCGLILATSYFFKTLVLTQLQPNQQWMASALLLLFAVKYLLSRVSVTQEFAIGKSLFPVNRVPDDLQMKDRKSIAFQVYGFMLLYLLLGYVSEHVILASLIMAGIAIGDFRTRYLINENMRQRFADKQYEPEPDDPERGFITARREVAEWYLFRLPHLCKELGVFFGTAAAFCVSLYGFIKGRDLNEPAFYTLIATHLFNEAITFWWRFDRYLRLKAVNAKRPSEIFEGS